MINLENELIKLVYSYYPTNLIGMDSRYNNSVQIKKHFTDCTNSFSNLHEGWIRFFEKINNIFMEYSVKERTTYFLNQPSFSIQISNYENNQHLFLYRSFIIPYYYTSYLDLTKPNNSQLNIKNIFNIDLSFINSELSAELFPAHLLNVIIPEISFELINFNEFTLKNAFFNRKDIII